jgi:hypothetical protein
MKFVRDLFAGGLAGAAHDARLSARRTVLLDGAHPNSGREGGVPLWREQPNGLRAAILGPRPAVLTVKMTSLRAFKALCAAATFG